VQTSISCELVYCDGIKYVSMIKWVNGELAFTYITIPKHDKQKIT